MSFGVPLSQLIVEKPAPLSTGLDAVDRALGSGGLEGGSIYEVYGPPGIGKTRLGADLVRGCLERDSQDRVLWCETYVPAPLGEMRDLASCESVYTVRIERFTELLVFFMKLISAGATTTGGPESGTTTGQEGGTTTRRERGVYKLIVIDGFSQLVVSHVNNLASRQKESSYQQRLGVHDVKCRDLILLFSTMTKYAVQHNCTIVLLDDCMNTAYQTDLPSNLEDTYAIVDDGSNFFVSGGSPQTTGGSINGGSTIGGTTKHVQSLRSALVANAGVGRGDSKWEVFLRARIGLLWDWAASATLSSTPSAAAQRPDRASGKSRSPDRVRVAIVYTDLGNDPAASGAAGRAGARPQVIQLPLVSAPVQGSNELETPTHASLTLSSAEVLAPGDTGEVVGDSEGDSEGL